MNNVLNKYAHRTDINVSVSTLIKRNIELINPKIILQRFSQERYIIWLPEARKDPLKCK